MTRTCVSFLVLHVVRIERTPPQHRDDQREHNHFLECAGPERRERFQLPDQQRAGQRQRVARQTAHDGGDEAFETDEEAGVVVNVVTGAISRPETAPIKAAASAKLRSPDSAVGMPISRAPTRLMVVARSALPTMVRSKKKYIATTSSAVTPMTTDWPVMVSAADVPARFRKRPVRELGAEEEQAQSHHGQCSATDTISRISTVACASGRNASRYTNGPMGVTRQQHRHHLQPHGLRLDHQQHQRRQRRQRHGPEQRAFQSTSSPRA